MLRISASTPDFASTCKKDEFTVVGRASIIGEPQRVTFVVGSSRSVASMTFSFSV